MASSISEKIRSSNGNRNEYRLGTAAPAAGDVWYGNRLGDAGVQRPRRLSFNGYAMELTDMKAANKSYSAEKKIDSKQMIVLLAIATTAALSIRYLLSSFKLAFFTTLASRGSPTAGEVWQDWLERLAHLRTATASRIETMVQPVENAMHVLLAVAFGLLVASFTWYMIYLDSSIPGVNPPTPFSASKKRYRGGSQATERRFHLGYITAVVSGVVVFLIALLG